MRNDEGSPRLFSVSLPLKADVPIDRVMATVRSLTGQKAVVEGRAKLQIVVVHGRLSPQVQDFLATLPDDVLSLHEEESTGIYPALAQAFPHHRGWFNTYLGAGDELASQAFDVVLEVSGQLDDQAPRWITGAIVGRREDGAVIRWTQPPRYLRRGLRRGWYGRGLPLLQQESTLWRRDLHKQIDLGALAEFRLAGDALIWRDFAETDEPLVVEAHLGSFRWHGDNMSGDWESYAAELQTLYGRLSLGDRFLLFAERFLWGMPNVVKKRVCGKDFLRFVWPSGPWV